MFLGAANLAAFFLVGTAGAPAYPRWVTVAAAQQSLSLLAFGVAPKG
jgi:hypothetical protein